MIGYGNRDRKKPPPRTGNSSKLISDNFREWRENLEVAALDYAEAGQGFRNGVMPLVRAPTRNDRRMATPPYTIITERELDNIRIPLLVAAVDAAHEAQIDADL